MTQVNTKFTSTVDGFHFINRFEFKFPVKFQLPFVGQVDLNDVVYGLCGGMCFSSLDYFYARKPVPGVDQVESIDGNLFVYLCDRQLDSLSIPTLLKVMQWMLMEAGEIGLRMTRYELPKLRRQLDKGEPAVLALIRVKGLGDPTHNHQVLATGYDYDPGTRQMTVQLYDPNHPGEAPSLHLDLNSPSQGIQLSQSTGEFLRGFFLISYSPQLNLPIPPAAVPSFAVGLEFAAPEFTLRWPVDSHRVNQFFGENPETYKPFHLPGHEGLDLFALSGANIYAAADGQVYQANHPKDHPYGLQIRIKHQADGRTYHTVYAHLQSVHVSPNQQVKAGDLIAQADNTGNSFGSHLHLTLKIDGEQTPGYPTGIVDPWPYLKDADNPPPPAHLPPSSGITVYTTIALNLRSGPSTDDQIIGGLPAGEALDVLGDAKTEKAKIGQDGQWLQIQTAGGLAGWVAAWFVQTANVAFPPSDLVVYPNDFVNLRSGPATTFDLLGTVQLTDPLTVLGSADNARGKLGKFGEWIQVQTEQGLRAFVAAWLVHATGQALPTTDLTVSPTTILNVRALPNTDANILTVVTPGDTLKVLGDKDTAQARIGQMDQWLDVRTPDNFRGFVAAWLVQSGAVPPTTGPAPSELTVFPTVDMNVRAQGSTNSPRVGGAFFNQGLKVIEADLAAARAKLGQPDNWMHVQLADGTRGWAAAWLLSDHPA